MKPWYPLVWSSGDLDDRHAVTTLGTVCLYFTPGFNGHPPAWVLALPAQACRYADPPAVPAALGPAAMAGRPGVVGRQLDDEGRFWLLGLAPEHLK